MRRLFSPSTQPTWMENFLVPLLGLLLIIIIDRSASSVLLTPLLSVCLLGILSFRLDTKVLVFWFLVLAINVVFSLIDNPGMKIGTQTNPATIIVRSIGFLVSGLIAISLNRGRLRLMRNHHNLLELIERLPCAVIVSDLSGTILFFNKTASTKLGKSTSEVIGLSFFSFFTSPEHRGHSIQNYLKIGDREVATETNLTIMTNSQTGQSVRATQIPMNLEDQKCIVSVIDFDPADPKQSEGLVALTAAR